jgi:anti-sigma factor RsiW
MSCNEIRELFSDHVDGAISTEAEDRLGEHLGACRTCREELGRYEAGLDGLAGTSPEPPPDLGERTARRLGSEGLLEGRRGDALGTWWSVAAALVFLGVGLAVGRATIPEEDGAGPEVGWAPSGWESACAAVPRVPILDPGAWRALDGAEGPDLVLPSGPHVLHLPRRLTSHGPYDAGTVSLVEQEGSTCLPLRTPFGTGLILSLRPGAEGEKIEADRFVVELDPQRVLYGRVLWEQDGLVWALEGRAETAELLDVAREIGARARVDRDGRRM